MRYLALACDYDGTLARDGQVDEELVSALTRLRDTGRRLLLVTGRELENLCEVFSQITLFDRVVAENGGLLYRPASREERILGDRPPEEFVRALKERGVTPLSVGRVIVATWHPHETAVLETIEQLGLEHQVIFNKGAVMVLPPGVNKASGLQAALDELSLSPHNVVGVGDAENDHAFLSVCECAAVVANALPSLKERADVVLTHDHGAGVIELIDQLVGDDLRAMEPKLRRHEIFLGTGDDGDEVRLQPYGTNVLIAGTSGSGKSTVATGILEQLARAGYQFCLVDPEGDFESLGDAVALGTAQQQPSEEEVLQLLTQPEESAIVNLLGLPMEDRPGFFAGLFPRLEELRARTGRPHWIALDEAHHLLPSEWNPATIVMPEELSGLLLLTVHPEHLAQAVLSRIDVVIAVGEDPQETIAALPRTLGEELPRTAAINLEAEQALVWFRRLGQQPFRIRAALPHAERRRHRRKYAAGELAPVKSFYFRGPDKKLNLRAQNLTTFVQLADGVDDATWVHHLRRGDYSHWLKEMIGDPDLAADVARVEQEEKLSPQESRKRIRELIEQRYTVPA